MHKFQIIEAIVKIAPSLKIDGDLVSAIVSTESAFNPYGVRYEPNYKWFNNPEKYAKLNGITLETEIECQKMSWGSMQIMGSTARDCGFNGILTELSDIYQGIYYGCLYLKKLTEKYPVMTDVISSYNAGSPVRTFSGEYKNKAYVQKVQKKYLDLLAINRGKKNG